MSRGRKTRGAKQDEETDVKTQKWHEDENRWTDNKWRNTRGLMLRSRQPRRSSYPSLDFQLRTSKRSRCRTPKMSKIKNWQNNNILFHRRVYRRVNPSSAASDTNAEGTGWNENLQTVGSLLLIKRCYSLPTILQFAYIHTHYTTSSFTLHTATWLVVDMKTNFMISGASGICGNHVPSCCGSLTSTSRVCSKQQTTTIMSTLW